MRNGGTPFVGRRRVRLIDHTAARPSRAMLCSQLPIGFVRFWFASDCDRGVPLWRLCAFLHLFAHHVSLAA